MNVTRTARLGLVLLFTSSIAVACRNEDPAAGGAGFSLTLGERHPSLDTLDFRAVGLAWLDDTTVAVIDRDWPRSRYRTRQVDSWFEIQTARMTVRYKVGSGAFTSKNLEVRWRMSDGEKCWRPGDFDEKNLGSARKRLDWMDAPPMHLQEARELLSFFRHRTDVESTIYSGGRILMITRSGHLIFFQAIWSQLTAWGSIFRFGR